MLPFFETETAAVIRKLYLERWVQWAGPPKEIVIDPARTNLGKSMVEPIPSCKEHMYLSLQEVLIGNWEKLKSMVGGLPEC
jgi:hypothetical protein